MKLEPSGKKGTFVGCIESCMEIDSEEKETSKDDHTDPSSLVVHPSDYQKYLVELVEHEDLSRDVAVTRKRPSWIFDILQDAQRHSTPHGTFRESKRPHSFSNHIESQL
jgi:hypothetical protein